jgi:hypothetical protein
LWHRTAIKRVNVTIVKLSHTSANDRRKTRDTAVHHEIAPHVFNHPQTPSSALLLLYVTGASAQSYTPDPVASLRSAKLICVKSSSLLVGNSVIEEKLQKQTEFSHLGLVITRDPNAADLILEVHHDRLTKYVYTAIDVRSSVVVASGKLSSLGGTVAEKVAKRFLKEVVKARATAPPKT